MKRILWILIIFLLLSGISITFSIGISRRLSPQNQKLAGAKLIINSIEKEAKFNNFETPYEFITRNEGQFTIKEYIQAQAIYRTNTDPWLNISDVDKYSTAEMIITRAENDTSIPYEVAIIKDFGNNTYGAITCWHVVNGERRRNQSEDISGKTLISAFLLLEGDIGGPAKDIQIYFEPTNEYFPVTGEAHDPMNDLSLIVFKVPETSKAVIKPISTGNSDELNTGNDLSVYGSPLGDDDTWTFGKFSNHEDIDEYNFPNMFALRHDAFSYFGNSGGPTFAVSKYDNFTQTYEYVLIGVTEFLRGYGGIFGPVVPTGFFAIPSNRLTGRFPHFLNQLNNPPKKVKLNFDVKFTNIVANNSGEYYQGLEIQNLDSSLSALKIKNGDIIVRVEGVKISDPKHFEDILTYSLSSPTANLVVLRPTAWTPNNQVEKVSEPFEVTIPLNR